VLGWEAGGFPSLQTQGLGAAKSQTGEQLNSQTHTALRQPGPLRPCYGIKSSQRGRIPRVITEFQNNLFGILGNRHVVYILQRKLNSPLHLTVKKKPSLLNITIFILNYKLHYSFLQFM